MKLSKGVAGLVLGFVIGFGSTAGAGWMDWLEQAGEAVSGADDGGADGAAAGLSRKEMVRGLKEALDVGVQRAVEELGREGGFLDNPALKIPMPAPLQPVETTLRRFGQDRLADDFVASMNHAAERAVPETLTIFQEAVRAMTLDDARRILEGPDDAATQYLRKTSGESIRAAIAPIVSEATERAGVTAAYKRMVGQVQSSLLGGYMDSDSLDLDAHVTREAVDGLFLQLASEEKRIREDPVARTTELLKQVFGRR